MQVDILNTENSDVKALKNLIEQLYDSPIKPRLSNLSAATKLITISEEGTLLGFVACYLNPSYPYHLILGNFECKNNIAVADKIFSEAKKIALKNNCKLLLGPMNGSTWFTYRYSLVKQTPFFMETIHKPYYIDLWKSYGFEINETYQTNIEDFNADAPMPNVQEYLAKRKLTIRKFDKADASNELTILHSFCMELFANNVLFSPISQDDFIALYQPILDYLDEELIDFVLDNDKVVGLFFAVKNHYNSAQVIVKTIARNPDDKYKGLANIMAANFYKKAIAMGYKSMLNAYFHLDNKSASVSENYGGRMYQKHVLFQLEL